MSTSILLALLIACALLGAMVWRWVSRRVALPCPPALIWSLEHRIMQDVAGSEAILQRAGIVAGMRVLDAGCGPGRLTLPLARRVGPEGEVVALDVQAEMLARLEQRLKDQGITNVRMLQAGLGAGSLAPAQFDRAIMVTVLGEIPNRLAALREVHDSLNPGGLLSITELLPDPHFQSRREVRRLGEQAGFTVEPVWSTWRAFTFNLIRLP
jgi:ubiquinone/menaquinone biosynthesis C-methylase UbiE